MDPFESSKRSAARLRTSSYPMDSSDKALLAEMFEQGADWARDYYLRIVDGKDPR